MNFLVQKFLGPIVRQIPGRDKTLYLTFDDGPSECTSEVLNLLTEMNIPATFFVIAKKVQNNLDILEDIQARGHSIGNHSYDHTYKPFLKGRRALLDWVQKSEEIMIKHLDHPTVGFRPPAGILTPELKWVLRELNLPLVLWNKRFFDKTFSWTPKKAVRSLLNTHSGDIILLHDLQSRERFPLFLNALKDYITAARERSFHFRPLTRELCDRAKQLKMEERILKNIPASKNEEA